MVVKELLQHKNIKSTKQREQVLNVLSESSVPLSLDEIESKCEGVDFSSIYRAVRLFIEKGIVKEHYFGGRKAKYNLIVDKKHNHFIKCVECDKIEELKNICIIDEVNRKTSFKIMDHYMEFTGLCPDCSKK